MATQPTELRNSGISTMGDVPWGTHFCHFYETKQDLLDILIPFLIAGLENNELCVVVVFDPVDEVDAPKELIRAYPAAAKHFLKDDIQIVPYAAWYLNNGVFDQRRAMEALNEKVAQALERGYAGLRVKLNETWLPEADWKNFARYEQGLNGLVANQKVIALCTYKLLDSKAGELFDVARTHQFAIAKRRGNWEVLETSELKQTKDELRRLSQQLEQRVVQRTAELAKANEELTTEIAEHRKTMERLRAMSENLRALSAKVQSAREEEGTRIAREIHDELGSALTTLKWDTEGLLELVASAGDQPPFPAVKHKLEAMVRVTDSIVSVVKRIASDLRPSILDDLGLIEALESHVQQFQIRTGIAGYFDSTLDTTDLDREQSIAVFRIFQEALTNILRHANATRVDIAAARQAGEFVLTIRDNGEGITDEAKSGPLSLGLLGMQERAHLIRGKIDITGAAGRGTTVTLRVPVSRPPSAQAPPQEVAEP